MEFSTDQALILLLADLQREKETLRAEVRLLREQLAQAQTADA